MKFINKNQPIKIRIGKSEDCSWVTLETGDTINLPEQAGINNGLEKVTKEQIKLTEGQIGDKKVETKQVVPELEHRLPKVPAIYTPDDLFFKELKEINGIGTKTAKDIVVWGTKEKLIEVIALKNDLPFRDDASEKLRRTDGK